MKKEQRTHSLGRAGLEYKLIGCISIHDRTSGSDLPEEEYPFCTASNQAMVQSLDFRSFILRARVLKLYRQALKITQRAPCDSKAELRNIIRQEFKSQRNCNDKQRIRFLISDGLERLKRLDEMLDMQGH